MQTYKKTSQAILVATALAMAIVAGGCSVINSSSRSRQSGYYYVNPDKTLPNVGRVVLVELSNNSGYPDVSADMTDALFQAAQKRQVFSISVVDQDAPVWRRLQLQESRKYSLDQLSAIRGTLNCNAILTGNVTAYQPYPHLSIGLKLRLIDLADGSLLWAFEHIWEATDRATEERIKKYYRNEIHSAETSLHEQLVTVSSLEFLKFVAYEVAETL